MLIVSYALIPVPHHPTDLLRIMTSMETPSPHFNTEHDELEPKQYLSINELVCDLTT